MATPQLAPHDEVDPTRASESTTVPAGMLAPWDVGELPAPPATNWKTLLQLLGPGVLLAGASVGTGEWLFGPAVSAQYGGTLLWLATISIVLQVFCNLEIMRYTIYCGEPVVVGYFRTRPGPMFWTFVYLILEVSMIWPYNASNAAVPLATACLGHLPGAGTIHVLGIAMTEDQLVKVLGYTVFFAAFIPLIFGGTIYRTLEKAMAFKLVIVLAYLLLCAAFMISLTNMKEVLFGFVQFGIIPLRAETVVSGRHFTFGERDGETLYTVKGTIEDGKPLITDYIVDRAGRKQSFKLGAKIPDDLRQKRDELVSAAVSHIEQGGFYVQDAKAGVAVAAQGTIGADGAWHADKWMVTQDGETRSYERLEDVPVPEAARLKQLVEHRGLEQQSLFSYWRQHGRLPDLDWGILAAFAAIAGAGNMTNTMFSNYARDKGWGMGARVGAIPSAIGGREITLSHVGMVFPVTAESKARWRGWMRHIWRDQFAIWMLCSFVGMALPCMLSLEFIRNAPVSGNRVAAMTAEGMAQRYPQYSALLWSLSLVVAFLVLAPGQIIAGEQIARRWTDILWNSSSRTKHLEGNQVKYIYYTILAIYAVWGAVTLALFDPLKTAKIGAVLGNIALGVSALHALYVNRMFLPRALQSNWFMQAGTAACGIFFLGISILVLFYS